MDIYEVTFNPEKDKGIYALSVVNDPAMESMFIALNKDVKEVEIQLAEVNKEQRILMGVALIPDKPIYRNQDGKEFYITFPAETIKAAAHSFLKNQHNNNSTIEHEIKLNDMSVIESWIVSDEKNDKSNAYGLNAPKGSWVAAMKVDNEEIWNDYVKTGKIKGFSIDGLFSLNKLELNKKPMDNNKTIIDEIKAGFMELKNIFKAEKIELATAELEDGTQIEYEGETLEEGTAIMIVSEDGEKSPAPDGEHTLKDGTKVSTEEGKVTEIKPVEDKSASEESESIVDEVTAKAEETLKDALNLNSEGVSAHLELPVGEHEIDGKIYTVVETIDNEGSENEWKHNVIVSIVPKEGATQEPTELSKLQSELQVIQTELKTALDSKDQKIAELEAQLATEPASKPKVHTSVNLSADDKPKTTKERLRLAIQKNN
ncbi:XkdF-like putative serine protease domain-containing protein [Maribacter sp. 2210JD10-5]|uniref:XkdF-like putative serine protease domain-containing protein n=1 Tax=Maribacter sp. 2210JD10-5 TaxID=3386272 RepID=UPI0039BC45C4